MGEYGNYVRDNQIYSIRPPFLISASHTQSIMFTLTSITDSDNMMLETIHS